MIRKNIAGIVAFLLLCSVIPMASAALPGDTDGDEIISPQEFVDVVIPYMESEYLEMDVECPDRDELSLIAHNCLRVPYGKVIIPVSSTKNALFQGNILNVGGGPTSSLVYEGLITKNSYDGVYDCWLAASWDVSSDASVWTFHLAENATWHDGVPVTSEDVKFTHDYIKDKNMWLSSVLGAVDHVECPDEHTAVFYLKSAYPRFDDQLSHCPGTCIIPKHIFENVDDPDHWQDEEFIGCGPFTYINRISDQSLHLQANDQYHGDVPYVDDVVLTAITSKDAQILALKSGEVDVVGELDPAVANSLSGSENIEICSIPDARGYELGFNTKTYPANITGFRKAMSHAVNRETIVNRVFGRHGTPTMTTFLMPGVAHDYVKPGEPAFDYDMEKAAAMLHDAGFVDTNGDGLIEDSNGNNLVLNLPVGGKGSSGGVDSKIAGVLKNEWAELGITVEIKQVESSQWFGQIHQSPVFLVGMPYLMHDDPEDLCHFGSNAFFGKANWYDYSNPEYDALVQQVRSTAGDEERKQIGYDMQDILTEDVPSVPICSIDSIFAYRSDRFTGWEDTYPMYWNIVDIKTLSHIKPISPAVKET